MPEVAGIDVIRAVRAAPDLGGVRVVLVTGEEDASQVQSVMAAGADGSIRKPFTAEVVRATLQRLGVLGGN